LCLTIGVLSRLLSYFEILESLKQGNVFLETLQAILESLKTALFVPENNIKVLFCVLFLEMKSAFEMCLIGTFMRTDSIQNLKTIYTYPKK